MSRDRIGAQIICIMFTKKCLKRNTVSLILVIYYFIKFMFYKWITTIKEFFFKLVVLETAQLPLNKNKFCISSLCAF